MSLFELQSEQRQSGEASNLRKLNQKLADTELRAATATKKVQVVNFHTKEFAFSIYWFCLKQIGTISSLKTTKRYNDDNQHICFVTQLSEQLLREKRLLQDRKHLQNELEKLKLEASRTNR